MAKDLRAGYRQTLEAFLADRSGARLESLVESLVAEAEPDFSSEELDLAGKQAWKNSERCIGRIGWEGLRVVDRREATSCRAIYEACLEHLVESTNEGRIVPMLSIFPSHRQIPGLRILSPQLVRYAGYTTQDGGVLGDPAHESLTEYCLSLGWRPPRKKGPFDPLPFIIDHPDEGVRWFPFPKEAILEVPIEHSSYGWFASLNIKWHALPAVSDQNFELCGLRYPCVFSGYYMGTEIGSRNLGDQDRYHLLPTVAERLGLNTSRVGSLWKDRALVELNSAVLQSFRQMGVMIVDHHTASQQFVQFCEKEAKQGVEVTGDWSWIVPPMSGSACPVFHRYYSSELREPRFSYYQATPSDTPP